MAIDFTKDIGGESNIDFFAEDKASGEVDGAGREEILKNKVANPPEKGFDILGGIASAGGLIKEGITGTFKAGEEAKGGAISALPSIAGNIAGGISDIGGDMIQKIGGIFGANISDEDEQKLGNWLREKGVEGEEQLQKVLQVDPESFATKTGAFGAEIATLFTPAGTAKLVGAIKGTGKLKDIGRGIVEGAELGVKGELVSEGEVSPEGLLVGGGIGGILRAGSQGINKLLPRTKEAIEDSLKKSIEGLVRFTAKSGKSTAQVVKERANVIQGGKTLQAFNPEFKITNKSNALEEVGGEITATKTKIFDGMRSIRGLADDAIISTEEIYRAFKGLKNSDKSFKALVEKGGGDTEFNRLIGTLKKGDDFYDEGLSDAYETIKILNSKSGNIFSSTSDNINGKVNSALSKVYNKIMDKKMGKLGGEYRDLNRAYSEIRNFEDSVAARFRTELSKSKGNVLGNLGDAYLDASLMFNIFNPAQAGQVLTTKALKEFFRQQSNPNNLMAKFMKDVRRFHGLEDEVISEAGITTTKEIGKRGTILEAEEFIK